MTQICVISLRYLTSSHFGFVVGKYIVGKDENDITKYGGHGNRGIIEDVKIRSYSNE